MCKKYQHRVGYHISVSQKFFAEAVIKNMADFWSDESYCFQTQNLKTYSRCKLVKYCSKQCQMKHLRDHKKICI